MTNKFLNKLKKEEKLERVESSENICNSYSEKSANCLKSAKLLLQNNLYENSIGQSYYAMYNQLLALLFRVGITKTRPYLIGSPDPRPEGRGFYGLAIYLDTFLGSKIGALKCGILYTPKKISNARFSIKCENHGGSILLLKLLFGENELHKLISDAKIEELRKKFETS